VPATQQEDIGADKRIEIILRADHIGDAKSAVYTSSLPSRYSAQDFKGFIIDTGAAERSTAGKGQFLALQKLHPEIKLETDIQGEPIHFGVGTGKCTGRLMYDTPIGRITFWVLDIDTPFLISIADLDRLRYYFNNLANMLIPEGGGAPIPVIRRYGHPVLLEPLIVATYVTETLASHSSIRLGRQELKRLHRRFGHPSAEKLYNLLDRAGHEPNIDLLKDLTEICEYCQKYGRAPRRFMFNISTDAAFNHTIIIDIMWISGKPVLHILDEGTRYQNGGFLRNAKGEPDMSALVLWYTLRRLWIDTYLGPPDVIVGDAGSNITAREFKHYTLQAGCRLKIVPVEAHHSIGLLERFHPLIKRCFLIFMNIPDILEDTALQMAFKAINDTAGPDGYVPTLLVYGAFPRLMEEDAPAATVQRRAFAMNKAMESVRHYRAEEQVRRALNTRNGPKTNEIRDLPLGHPVLVWREKNGAKQGGTWTGPFPLVNVQATRCTIRQPHGNVDFRITSVKPYYDMEKSPESEPPPKMGGLDDQEDTIVVEAPTQPRDQTPIPALRTFPARRRAPPKRYDDDMPGVHVTFEQLRDDAVAEVHCQLANDGVVEIFLAVDPKYHDSRQKEVTGLIEKGVFRPVNPKEVPKGTRIFGSRFVDEMKNPGTKDEKPKSRLVVQAFNDEGKSAVLTQSPTIQRASQRCILCIYPSMRRTGAKLLSRDVTQAYTQSGTRLNRRFFIRPTPELALALGISSKYWATAVVEVLWPLYGVPESGNHWYKRISDFEIKELGLKPSPYDPCLFSRNDDEHFGIVGLQTDDTLIVANDKFAALEDRKIKEAGIECKERTELTVDKPMRFNGAVITQHKNGCVSLTQERQCKNLSTVTTTRTDKTSSRGIVREGLDMKEQYRAQRALGAYVASMCQPEASCALSQSAQVKEPTEQDAKTLNKTLQWQSDNPTRGLKFVPLDLETPSIKVFTDSSFANNRDLSSQIGYLIVLADAQGRANIVHYASIKCQRVTRSVLASELIAAVHGFDMGAAIKGAISAILNREVPLVLCTDSKSLYDCLVKLGTTTEKRLMIDIMAMRESYERKEIAEVKWIAGDSNPADPLTKVSSKANSSLQRLIDGNLLEMEVLEWVERS
jgi:hypothetical protein